MKTRNLLLFLLSFHGLGAIFGGGIFIISPMGKLFGMPFSILYNSPFTNFLVPGFILFTILGLFPIGVMLALLNSSDKKTGLQNCRAV